MALVPAITREVRALDPSQPLADVKPLNAYLGQSVAQRRFSMTMLAIFSGAALVPAALGARESTVATMVVREALGVVGLGLLLGTTGALALTRVLASLLYEVSPTDPATFLSVAVVLGAWRRPRAIFRRDARLAWIRLSR